MRKISTGFLLFVVLLNYSKGQTFPVTALLENGPRDNRINMVFLGDGYKLSEMDKFRRDVQATMDTIFNQSPYKEYKNLFNVYAIEVPSNESGTDHPGTAADCPYKDSVFTRDTYFNTTFDANNIHRLLVVGNVGAMYTVLQNNFPDYDMIMIVVNHDWYGGSGGSRSVFSTNEYSAEIAIHEAGHSFANLADEYDYGYDDPIQFEGINVTWRTQLELIPWKTWILEGTKIPTPNDFLYDKVVGLFEGAFYRRYGMYRPKYRCKMKELSIPFCEVCREQHVKSIFSYVDLIDSYLPENKTVTMLNNAEMEFNIGTLQLPFSGIGISWILDGSIVAENTESILLDGSSISVGNHILSVVAEHRTDFVRNDPNNFLESTISWSINVVDPTGVEEQIPNEFVLEQNYPNPFNPETLISYKLPVAGHVTLKVYDALGREVTTLVDEYKQPGSYSSRLSTDNFQLSSGLYFYILRAGEFSQTKKMILLR